MSYFLNGIFFGIHKELGRYRNERQYADRLEAALRNSSVNFQREVPLSTSFDGEHARRNIPDFLIENKIVVDLKAKPFVTKEDYFQMKRYLVSSRIRLGIIVNFRQRHLVPKRVLSPENPY